MQLFFLFEGFKNMGPTAGSLQISVIDKIFHEYE